MKKLFSILFMFAIPVLIFAQKNVIPVSKTQLLNMQLPEGSKQDKRMISVAAASSFLSMSTEYKNVNFLEVEVYSVPPTATSGFKAENVLDFLNTNGYSLLQDKGDSKLVWATKDKIPYLIYFSTETKETNIYIGRGSKNPLEINYPTQTGPMTSSISKETGVVQTKVNHPEYVPPLMGRQSGSTVQKTVIKEDPLVVYDLDNNRYNVMKIGENFWLKENLRTTQYNDTTRIPSGEGQDWSKLKHGAFTFYDNSPINREKYGLLYNGYAAASGKLCPEGWHVATDKEWNELEQFYGIPAGELDRTGERGNIAVKLKVAEGWNASAFSGNNSSGFSIMPAGSRNDKGEYTTLGQYGNFWTSTVYDDRYGLLYLWNHHVHYNTNAVGRIYTVAQNGYSCRCVKDKPKPVKTK